MKEMLKKIYFFLFRKHNTGFMRFCWLMLIPCALWEEFNRWWMLFMSFILMLLIYAKEQGWKEERLEQNESEGLHKRAK